MTILDDYSPLLMVNLFLMLEPKQINIFFTSICTSIESASGLPSPRYQTNSRIKYFQVTENDILHITKSLDPKKVHG